PLWRSSAFERGAWPYGLRRPGQVPTHRRWAPFAVVHVGSTSASGARGGLSGLRRLGRLSERRVGTNPGSWHGGGPPIARARDLRALRSPPVRAAPGAARNHLGERRSQVL